MNDWKLGVDRLEKIIDQSKERLSFGEKAGLYAAACVLLVDIEQHVMDYVAGNSYAREKITGAKGHIGAALGFDVDNGHDAEAHRVWALGDLSTLKSVLERAGNVD